MRNFGVHLNALRAFEAAARLGSFSHAAEELCVTHSTVSHHILGLERNLGVALFVRHNRQISLTPAGEALYPALKSSFDMIYRALNIAKSRSAKKSVNVTVTPSFANKWLIPRLRHFQHAHPGTEIQVSSSLTIADFDREGFDVGIRTGLGNWKGLNARLLMPISMTPLCSPSLFAGRKQPTDPGDLLDFTLLHADVSPNTGIDSEWREWFSAVRSSNVDCGGGLSFRDPGMALQAAINGLGVAMGYIELAEQDIAANRLTRLFKAEIRHPWSYFVVTPKEQIVDLQTTKFCEWLLSQVACPA